jgi:phosphoadenosine phosphosulfate reductase
MSMPAAGLDLDQLRAVRRPHPATTDLQARIRAHLDAHDGYVALSGGKDSVVVLHLALAADPNVPVCFFDSGFEYPETYAYLEQLQNQLNVQLQWITARRTTLQVLVEAGGWDHRAPAASSVPDLHAIRIGEPATTAHAWHGPGELWGVRAEEAHGRRARYLTSLREEIARSCHGCCPETASRQSRRRHGGVIRRQDGTVAYGPIWDWKTVDVWSYLARHQLPANPVYAKLRRLGAPEHLLRVSHILDGNRLEEGRLTWLRRGWPDLFEDLATVLPRVREYI